MNHSNLEKASDEAIKLSKKSNLSELRSDYKPSQQQQQQAHAFSFASGGAGPMRMMRASPAAPSSVALDGFVAAAPPPGASAAEDSYAVTNDAINYAQSERLVQKAISRINKKH